MRKLHYWWPVTTDVNANRWEEIVALTGTFNFRLEQIVNSKHVDWIKKGLTWSPKAIGMHTGMWGTDYVAKEKATDLTEYTLEYIRKYENYCQMAVSTCEVDTILIDSEFLKINKDNKSAITFKHDITYNMLRKYFPNAFIFYYGSGITRDSSMTGWGKFNFMTYDEKQDAISCALYSVPEIGYTRETMRRSAELSVSLPVIPWIALASGFGPKRDKFWEWRDKWDYDIDYSYQLGKEINHPWYGDRPERYAPWNRATFAVFYPQPFRNDIWYNHFKAYVEGSP
jgi:hypothetical protein